LSAFAAVVWRGTADEPEDLEAFEYAWTV